MSFRSTSILIVKILCRILAIIWGLITIWPSMMMCDSGTDLAVTKAYILLSGSIFFILSGAFGKWILACAAVFAIVMVFIPFPEKFHLYLLRTLVPVGMLVAFLYAFGWIGPRDPSSDIDPLMPTDNGTDTQVNNETDKPPSMFRDLVGLVLLRVHALSACKC